MKLINIILPSPPRATTDNRTTYDIEINHHVITSIIPHAHHTDDQSPYTSADEDTKKIRGARKDTEPCPPPSLLLPTLCHPHIHLDKAYLLTSHYNDPSAYPSCCPQPHLSDQHVADSAVQDPATTASTTSSAGNDNDHLDYASLAPRTGEFTEALQLTSKAKSLYTYDDLLLRGAQLLATSYRQGVTSARCFVEVDHVTRHVALEVGLDLKERFEGFMRVQICAFAQDPIFSTKHGETNRRLMEEALEKYVLPKTSEEREQKGKEGKKSGKGIEVLGTTPYVEDSMKSAVRNIEWAITTALRYGLHLDFHLDYNLDESKDPGELMIWEVLRLLQKHEWPTKSSLRTREAQTTKGEKQVKTVVLGHCTALTLLSHDKLLELSTKIRDSSLPLYFVGLPTSDLYMMGRPPSLPLPSPHASSSQSNTSTHQNQMQPLHRPRGTLNPLTLMKEYGLEACLGVNNVGNAFTPFGTGDLLALASWGVGLYQGGGKGDAEILYDCVSGGARRAVGIEPDGEEEDEMESFTIREGQSIRDFGLMLVKNEDLILQAHDQETQTMAPLPMSVPARRRISVRDVVWDVPELRLRSVIR